jgi:hypothetical protein
MQRSLIVKLVELIGAIAIGFILLGLAWSWVGPGTKVGNTWSNLLNGPGLLTTNQQSQPPAAGDSVVGGPSLSGDYINSVLQTANSPAKGTGQSLHDLSAQYNVDDAYALAVFMHESTYGLYGAANENHALGNIVCAGYPTCNGRFRAYPTWQAGYEDFYRLLTREYIPHGLSTVETITPVYAPASENDPTGYIASVRSAMAIYRRENAA